VYTVEVVGTGYGSYHFSTALFLDEETFETQNWMGEVINDVTYVYEVQIATDGLTIPSTPVTTVTSSIPAMTTVTTATPIMTVISSVNTQPAPDSLLTLLQDNLLYLSVFFAALFTTIFLISRRNKPPTPRPVIEAPGIQITVEDALSTLKQLAQVYERVAWQTLLNEFGLNQEEDLKALLFKVGLLGELELKIDEGDKTVRFIVTEEIPDLKPRMLHCPSCEGALGPRDAQCPSCGNVFPPCVICRQPTIMNLTKTPCCGAYAHAPHLQEWLRIKGTCPVCREKLQDWMIS
jgi:hypothetical protein